MIYVQICRQTKRQLGKVASHCRFIDDAGNPREQHWTLEYFRLSLWNRRFQDSRRFKWFYKRRIIFHLSIKMFLILRFRLLASAFGIPFSTCLSFAWYVYNIVCKILLSLVKFDSQHEFRMLNWWFNGITGCRAKPTQTKVFHKIQELWKKT